MSGIEWTWEWLRLKIEAQTLENAMSVKIKINFRNKDGDVLDDELVEVTEHSLKTSEVSRVLLEALQNVLEGGDWLPDPGDSITFDLVEK